MTGHGCKRGRGGFTMLEVIVAITIVGLLSLVMFEFLSTVLHGSVAPLQRVSADVTTVGRVETMTSDYVRLINSGPDAALATLAATDYGSGVSMQYIEFDAAGAEQVLSGGAVSNVLKVTVQNGGRPVAVLFTRSRTTASDAKATY